MIEIYIYRKDNKEKSQANPAANPGQQIKHMT